MRHLKKGKKFGRPRDHRKALMKMLCYQIIKNGSIVTTEAKAKYLRTVIEPLITKAKKGGLHNVRLISKVITDKALITKLCKEVAPLYAERNGGYTRILKLENRAGDNAPMVLIELVDREKIYKKETPKEKSKKQEVKETKEIKTTKEAKAKKEVKTKNEVKEKEEKK
ncbi:MAG: 50S ribosomal protein L17 [Candidatus Goldbacteria bacterium]|nr:50S ribosomal protein L17 [Candidatus Goldiibacteriota bacterium]HPD18604.1 50S ribosomal protein L17 [Candidatus Goldiibacteriota bacterium]